MVLSLRKTGELGGIVDPHIDDPLGTRLAQQVKETLGGFFVNPMVDNFIALSPCTWRPVSCP